MTNEQKTPAMAIAGALTTGAVLAGGMILTEVIRNQVVAPTRAKTLLDTTVQFTPRGTVILPCAMSDRGRCQACVSCRSCCAVAHVMGSSCCLMVTAEGTEDDDPRDDRARRGRAAVAGYRGAIAA